MSSLKAKLKKYFSGRMVIVQIAGGVGAFAGRSLGAVVTDVTAQPDWIIVVASLGGSFTGYISVYVLGYWLAFRREYAALGRSMRLDVLRLQIVEQLPSVGGVIFAALTQALIMDQTATSPVISANLASWFGPQKIANLVAMFSSNSLKKAWVDGSWSPRAGWNSLKSRVTHRREGDDSLVDGAQPESEAVNGGAAAVESERARSGSLT